MNDNALPKTKDQNWELPSYVEALFMEKNHQYALVIPVINEGERIRSQLMRIKQAQLPVDVIVADGGSTDGSLDPAFIQTVPVVVVLTKTGPGKLSAQLRMAYAWCIKQNYAGIVTIDGNGKDGVEAIAEMVAKLEEGYDYVQGSRYLPGGAAENTPLERTIANRFIHAPLLSIAGRHWFTDTTNGFRAYSTRYLLDPRVKPFRDVFQRYELLFYLSVRAGQLGYKVGHTPVVRRYPENRIVPTKIKGITSKLELLGETISAATGGYTPDNATPKNPTIFWPFLAIILVIAPLIAVALFAPSFSPDSWAYYELGQTVFGDFYRFSHFRSYANTSPYSSSFPPLLPVAIALLDELLDTGARTGIFLSFASFVAFAVLSERIGRQIFGFAWLGLSVSLLLIIGPGMLLGEMLAGRSIPLQLCLYAIVLLCLLQGERIDFISSATIGLVAGIAILNRFDAILLPIFSTFLIWWLTRRPVVALVALASSIIALLPWISYSISTFDTAFATDNSIVATSLDPKAFVTDWWPSAQPVLMDDPASWFARIFSNFVQFFFAIGRLISSRISFVFILALIPIVAAQYLISYTTDRRLGANSRKYEIYVLTCFTLIMVAMLMPQVLTGYFSYRYFTALFWAGFMLIGGSVLLNAHSAHQSLILARIFFLVIFFAILSYSVLFLVRSYSEDRLNFNPGHWQSFDAPEDIQELRQCTRNDATSRILVIGNNSFAARAGALGGLRTMMEPRNMSDGRLGKLGSRSFLEAWEVKYVLVAKHSRRDFARDTFNLIPVPDCSLMLFRVLY